MGLLSLIRMDDYFSALETAVTFICGLIVGRFVARCPTILEVSTVLVADEPCDLGFLEGLAERAGLLWEEVEDRPVVVGLFVLVAYQGLSLCLRRCCSRSGRRAADTRYVGPRAPTRPALLG